MCGFLEKTCKLLHWLCLQKSFITAGKIQLSPEANHLLTKVIGGFRTEPRGETLIKVMFNNSFYSKGNLMSGDFLE